LLDAPPCQCGNGVCIILEHEQTFAAYGYNRPARSA
jgi:hypothetical protein